MVQGFGVSKGGSYESFNSVGNESDLDSFDCRRRFGSRYGQWGAVIPRWLKPLRVKGQQPPNGHVHFVKHLITLGSE